MENSYTVILYFVFLCCFVCFVFLLFVYVTQRSVSYASNHSAKASTKIVYFQSTKVFFVFVFLL